jgi:hypothetical protein
MPHSEAQAWWADVQHVRESIERRRAGLADSSAPVDAPSERRFVRDAEETLPPLDDLDWTSSLSGDSGRRFVHTSEPQRTAPERASRLSDDGDADEHVDIDAELAALQTEHPARRSRSTERRRRPDGPASTTAPTAGAALEPPPPARRTVQITGRTVAAPALPRLVEVERRRPARPPAERVGPRPDRIALWAVLLGFFLILVAATSSNAATPAHTAEHAAVALHAPAR